VETFPVLDAIDKDIIYEVKDRLARISCEILLHIIVDPSLACLVKDMALAIYTT